MEPISLGAFSSLVGGDLAGGRDTGLIQSVSTHTDRIQPGAAFFALKGSRTDGHDYVRQAARNGAAVAVVEAGRVAPATVAPMPLVQVDDPLLALQRLAAWWRDSIDATVVAVVGSNGKTVTKDALVHFTSYVLSVCGSPGSYNSQLGVPLAVLGCPKSAGMVILELAVSEPGEMLKLERLVRPDHVVLTNVGSRWSSKFSSRGHQISELLSIACNIDSDGWVLLGQHDPDIRRVLDDRISCQRLYLADSSTLPVFTEPQRHAEGMSVRVSFPDGFRGMITVHTPSDEILIDVELAISAAWLLGIDGPTLRAAAEEYRPTSMRVEIWRSPRGVIIMRDVVTPDPIAVVSAVRAGKRLVTDGGRIACVLGEPRVAWSIDEARGLGRALVKEEADLVLGLNSDSHQRTASVIEDMDAGVSSRLFDSVSELRGYLVENFRLGDVVLLQSQPDRFIDDLATSLMESMAPTRLYLDVSAIEDNVAAFRRHLGPSVRIMGMVKALAYGTEWVNVSLCLQDAGVDTLGVSAADEGVALRRAGITLPILVVLGTAIEMEKMVRYRLMPLIYSPQMLDAVLNVQAESRASLAVHIDVDTGMHRSGFQPRELRDALRRLLVAPHVAIEGLMTHLACADDPSQDAFTSEQLARFGEAVSIANELGMHPLLHAAATAGAIRIPESRFDMVRIGLGLYGVHPSDATRGLDLVPALGLVSRIIQIIDVPEGERVGYGGTYAAPPGGARIGVVPGGYHDCVPRAFSNFGHVIVAGVQCPIVGRVSMDSMTIDLSGCPEAYVGADVLIYGRRGEWLVSFEEVSEKIGTIPYEVMARIGPRVQRIFTRH